ncbi:MAG: sigma-70 family RNA polymerase sigma factor, partial [Chloroflexota bacterium]|nr:sigma-70 family RNA polymerase sigma factor [Chloroflexota bacterium]
RRRMITRAPRPWHVPEDEDIWLGKLAGAARAGDRGARDALWLAVGPRLAQMAHRAAWAFPTLERDDAVQETFPIFAGLVATWPGPEATGAGFATYLFGMFRWRLYSILRTYERRFPATTTAWNTGAERYAIAPPPVHAPVAWHEYGVDFPAFIARLPDHEQEILLLRIREGLDTRDIAARLGLTPRTVSRHWNVTLGRLRALVQRGNGK